MSDWSSFLLKGYLLSQFYPLRAQVKFWKLITMLRAVGLCRNLTVDITKICDGSSVVHSSRCLKSARKWNNRDWCSSMDFCNCVKILITQDLINKKENIFMLFRQSFYLCSTFCLNEWNKLLNVYWAPINRI
jgi:hypothetical protein